MLQSRWLVDNLVRIVAKRTIHIGKSSLARFSFRFPIRIRLRGQYIWHKHKIKIVKICKSGKSSRNWSTTKLKIMFSAHTHNQVSIILEVHSKGSMKGFGRFASCVCVRAVCVCSMIAPPIISITCSVFLTHVYLSHNHFSLSIWFKFCGSLAISVPLEPSDATSK